MAEQLVKADVIAQIFGVSVRRVQQLTQEGICLTVRTAEGGARRYDLVPTIQVYIKYLSDKAYGKSSSEKESELKQKKLEAEIALKDSQGELHRLRTAIAAGKYISVEDVKLDYSKFFVVFKKFAMAIPSRIAGLIAGYVEPVTARGVEKDLLREITAMMNTFVLSAEITDEKAAIEAADAPKKRGRPKTKEGTL